MIRESIRAHDRGAGLFSIENLGSYLMSGPPDIDIRDISFKLRYITCVSQSFSRIYVGFGLQSWVWWGEPVGLDKNACVRSILCGIIG